MNGRRRDTATVTITLTRQTMIDYCDTNIHFKFRLTRADGSEVQPLWMVLAALAGNGFRIEGGRIQDTHQDGSFAWGAAVYKERGILTMAERDALRAAAMQRV